MTGPADTWRRWSRRDRLLVAIVPFVLVALGTLGIVRHHRLDQSSWRGVSFGMFATYDNAQSRVVRTEIERDGVVTRVDASSAFRSLVERSLVVPGGDAPAELARRLRTRTDVDRAVVEVWRIEVDGDDGELRIRVEPIVRKTAVSAASSPTGLLERVRSEDHFLLVARLSLLLLVVNSNEQPAVLVMTAVAAMAMFLRPALLRSAWPWFVLAALTATAQLLEWWRVDDHITVTTYWALAIGLSRLADRPDRALGVSARLLVGLVFAFAFGWKLLSPQFTSTDFFRYELVADDRFAFVAEHVGGTDPEVFDRFADEVGQLRAEGTPDEVVVLEEGDRNGEIAWLFTAWGLLIEGAIAAVFLLPLPHRLGWMRPAALFAFAYTTYAVVPVAGFGALLMTLALAMHDERRLRLAYVGSFVLLLAWGAVFAVLVG